jgi:membrane protease subunit HflC
MTRLGLFLLVLLAVLLFASAAFIVREDKQVIITQFGNPVGDPITEPGLHFKVPILQKAFFFDKRFLEWEGDAEELPTKDKVFIFVDAYARWRIADPLLFFQRLRDERGAQSRLDDILDGETRNVIAKHDLIELIRSTNRAPIQDEDLPDLESTLESISVGREELRQQILDAAKERTADLGIEVLDVEFKRINYGEQVEADVYNRMISERRRIADRFRSEGQGEASRILGKMERELKRIQSEAYREAREIRGRADAEATDIFASAYNQSAEARSFYEFMKTMETFEATVDENTWLMLSTDGDFYRFLEASAPR